MRKNNRVILLDSPIEFILIGTINNKRTVIAQSRNAKLDLKSYASMPVFLKRPTNHLFDIKIKLVPIKLESDVEILSDNIRDDTLTFIWRGLSSGKDNDYLQRIFDEYATNIFFAYTRGDDDDFEWFLSDIVTLCSDILQKNYNMFARKRFFYLIILSMYIILFSILSLKVFENVITRFFQ